MNATLLQQHLRSATGTTVSTQTDRNRFHGVGLYARRPLVCVRLTSRHRRDRREHIFIWRDRGSRNNPAFVHERVRFGGGGVLEYGGISIDGRTDLYIIRDGPLTARRYRGRNRTNGMASVFSRYESNRARLGRSMKTSCWPPTTPTNSPRTGKSSSGRVEQNTPTRD
ncbi:transposable element Tcb2 transposase [Trichonephila clavipes]|nr:transposable element Tcb2 transposase [Trichonephila clavipes]